MSFSVVYNCNLENDMYKKYLSCLILGHNSRRNSTFGMTKNSRQQQNIGMHIWSLIKIICRLVDFISLLSLKTFYVYVRLLISFYVVHKSSVVAFKTSLLWTR